MTGAALVVVALGAVVALAWARRRGEAPSRPLRVEARAGLGRESGVALVQVHGERLVVGWGRDGVRLVRRLGPPGEEP